jgi:broad specificity phosphatase PhoE
MQKKEDGEMSKLDEILKRLESFEIRLQKVEESTKLLSLTNFRTSVDKNGAKSQELPDMFRFPSAMWRVPALPRVLSGSVTPHTCSEKVLGVENKKPLRILLIRHAESEGNVSPKAYEIYQDHGLPLTKRGVEMAEITGEKVSSHLDNLYKRGVLNLLDDKIGIYVSPYLRTRSTLQGLLDGGLSHFINEDCIWESQYLTEMDWGLFEGDGWLKTETREMPEYERNRLKRAKNGKFYARCPNGESVKDVVMRVDLFIRRLLRRYLTSDFRYNTFVIVSHGITIRAFIMRWFHLGPLWYEKSTNHPNCSVYEIFEAEHKFIFGGYDKQGQVVSLEELNQNLVREKEVRYKYYLRKRDSSSKSSTCHSVKPKILIQF